MSRKTKNDAGDRVVGAAAVAVTARVTPSTPPPPLDGTAQSFPDLASLVAHHGEATVAEVMTALGDPTEASLAEEGRRVATPRATSDALRIYVAATRFLATKAPEVTRVKLSPTMLRLGAWVASQAERAHAAQAHAKAAQKTAGRAHEASVDATDAKARGLRDQLADTVTKVAGSDAAMLSAIRTALQPAAHGLADTSLGASLASLVAVGRAQLASDDAKVRARCGLFNLTVADLDACAAAADSANATLRKAEAPKASSAHTQTEVDIWDGMNLALLACVVDAFAVAHEVDARVPKLAFVSLRSHFVHKRVKPTKAAKPAGGEVGGGDG